MISLDEPSNRGRKNRDAKKPTEIPSITMDFIGDRNKASAQSLITSSGPTGPIVNPLYLQEGGTKLDLTEFTPPLGDKNEPSNFRIQAASGTLHAVISQQTKTGIESHKQPDGKASAITISGDPTVFTGAKLVKNTDPSSKAAYNLILQHANKEQGVDVLAEGPLTLETQTVENGKPITRALEVLDKDGKLMSGLTPDNFAEKIKAMPVKAESQAAAPTPTSPPKKSASR